MMPKETCPASAAAAILQPMVEESRQPLLMLGFQVYQHVPATDHVELG